MKMMVFITTIVIWKKGPDKIVHRTYETMPWIISRYMKVAGEIYGEAH